MATEPIIAEIHLLTRKFETLTSGYEYLLQLARTEKGFQIVRVNIEKSTLASLSRDGELLKRAPVSAQAYHTATIGKAAMILDVVFTGEKSLHKIERTLNAEQILFKLVRRKK